MRHADEGVGDEEQGGAAGSAGLAYDGKPHVLEIASATNGKEGSEHIAASETAPVGGPHTPPRGRLAGIAAAFKPQVLCPCALLEQNSLVPRVSRS